MRRLVALVAVLLLAVCALGDGTYAKLGALGRPNIPHQRGVISFRNGVETMIVESRLDGPSGDYVWIIPLPNPPSSVVAVESHLLDRSFRRLSPRIIHSGSQLGSMLPVAIVWLILGFAAVVASDPKRRFLNGLAVFLFAVVAAIFLSPVYAGNMAVKGVEQLGAIRAGDYRVDILKSRRADELIAWVKKRGGTLPDEAKSAVEAYSKEGWCFAVAQLDQHPGGQATPHPLAFTFKSDRMIYPMRLTGTQPRPVLLDLAVIGPGTASLAPLRVWRSDRYASGKFTGKIDEATLFGSPIDALAEKDEPVTRLRGEVSPSQMTKDFEPTFGEFKSQRLSVVNPKAEIDIAKLYGVLWGSGVAVIAGIFIGLLRKPKPTRVAIWAATVLVSAVVAHGMETSKYERVEPDWLAAKASQ